MLIIDINELIMFTQVCHRYKNPNLKIPTTLLNPILMALCHNMYKASMLTFYWNSLPLLFTLGPIQKENLQNHVMAHHCTLAISTFLEI